MVKPTELRYKVGRHFHFEQVWQLDGLVNARYAEWQALRRQASDQPTGGDSGSPEGWLLSQPDPVHVKPKNLKAVDVEACEALPDDEGRAPDALVYASRH